MGRKKSKLRVKRLPLTLLEVTHNHLQKLVDSGIYGSSPTEAAKNIVLEHLRKLEKAGKLKAFGDANAATEQQNGDKER
jgi:hypothetical protein